MQTRTHSQRLVLAVALFMAVSFAAASLGAMMVWGVMRQPVLTLGALAASAFIVWVAAWLRNAIREWRWNAGHRLR
jgi:uncharacterized membrane protein